MAEHSPLLPLAQKYFEQDIVGATHSLEMMDENDAIEVLKVLPIPLIVRAMKHLQVSYAASLLANADPELFKSIVSSLEPQFATTIFMHLPEDTRRSLIQHVPEKLKEQFREVLTYPEDSIGRLMSTDFLSFNKDIQVGKVVEKIRALTKRRYPSSYAYVIDDEEHLVGVINMRDLMLATPKDSLESVMRKDVFSLHCFVDREEAANELSKRRYFAAPVVDSQNHILGIIKAEQLLQGIQEEVTEDLQRMFGAGGDERTFSPVSFSLKQRLPWLHVNLATAFLAAAVVAMFEDVIAKITILAVFLPVVAGQGGNAGAQSLAVVMRGLVMREIPREKVRRLHSKRGGHWSNQWNSHWCCHGTCCMGMAWKSLSQSCNWFGNVSKSDCSGNMRFLDSYSDESRRTGSGSMLEHYFDDPDRCNGILCFLGICGIISELSCVTLYPCGKYRNLVYLYE